MSELNPFQPFDKRTTRLIKETAAEFEIDEKLAALMIYDFEKNCEKYVKFRWNFRIPALGLFYLSKAKVKKQKYKNGREEKQSKKTNVLLETQYNTYLDKKREAYRERRDTLSAGDIERNTENSNTSRSGTACEEL